MAPRKTSSKADKPDNDEASKPDAGTEANAGAEKAPAADEAKDTDAAAAELAKAKEDAAAAQAEAEAAKQEAAEAKAEADATKKELEKLKADAERAADSPPDPGKPVPPGGTKAVPVLCNVRINGQAFGPGKTPAMTRAEFDTLKTQRAVEGTFEDY